jgi:hypothetical protein
MILRTCFSIAGIGRLIEGTMNGVKYRQIRVQMTLDWGEDLHSNRTMTSNIQPKQRWNLFQRWNAVHHHCPSNFTELEKKPKFRCAELIQTYPRRLKTVITTKGASAKY